MSTSQPRSWTHAALQARVNRSPFNAWLGLELVEWGDGLITLALRPRPETMGHAAINALHGGIVASVLDAGCSLAVVTRTGESVVTVDMRIDFLRPATASAYTIAAGILRSGRMLATSDATVFSADGTKIACGRALLQHIPEFAGEAARPPG